VSSIAVGHSCRAWAATFAVVGLSDSLQFGYDQLKEL
jgi:hypothetical protein